MKLIEPSVFLIYEEDKYKKIELAGRTCYKSEDKITDESAGKFVSMLVKNKHLAMVEHATYVYSFVGYIEDVDELYNHYINYPYLNISVVHLQSDTYRLMLSGNLRAFLENNLFYFVGDKLQTKLEPYLRYVKSLSTIDNIKDEEIAKHLYTTIRFICDRGVSHELVRHRKFSFAQESTRYVNYKKKGEMLFIKPCSFDSWNIESQQCFLTHCREAEQDYKYMLNQGRTSQEARAILPNALKTEVVVTGNHEEWLHFFHLRCASDAHPDMIVVAKLAKYLYNEANKDIIKENIKDDKI